MKGYHDTDLTKPQQYTYNSNKGLGCGTGEFYTDDQKHKVNITKDWEGKIPFPKHILNSTHIIRYAKWTHCSQKPNKVTLTNNISIKWSPVDSNNFLFVVGSSFAYQTSENSQP